MKEPTTNLTFKDLRMLLLQYEVAASWWAGFIGNTYLSEIAANYFAWKVNRKAKSFEAMILQKMRLNETPNTKTD